MGSDSLAEWLRVTMTNDSREEASTCFVPRALDESDVTASTVSTLRARPLDLSRLAPLSDRDLQLRSTLAEGGMGRVVLAREPSLERDVAVKVAKRDPSGTKARALVREALMCASLEHPSIVPVYALGTTSEGEVALVMRRVDGVSWSQLLDDPDHPGWANYAAALENRLDVHLEILITICRALELAHERGIVHRDVKPSNVMLGSFGETYLVDWGLATRVGAPSDGIAGTPAYMAPEMVTGSELDERTDVYLLGATLHRVLTGEPRHRAATLEETVAAAKLSAPARYGPNVPLALGALCNWACSASKRDRPASVAVFRQRLMDFRRYRSSLSLVQVGFARLMELESLLSEAGDAPPPDLSSAYRIATEARFGFAQALLQCPDHAEARRGATRTVEALIELELRQGHADTAAALSNELGPPAPALAHRIEVVRREQEERRDESVRLRALERDLDPAPSWRGLVVLILTIMLLRIVVAVATGPETSAPAPVAFPVIAAVPILVVLAGAALLRRWLFANAFSCRLVWLVVLGSLASIVSRSIAVRHGGTMAVACEMDLLIGALTAGAAAATVFRSSALVVPILLAGLVAIELRPESCLIAFVGAILATCAALPVILWQNATPSVLAGDLPGRVGPAQQSSRSL